MEKIFELDKPVIEAAISNSLVGVYCLGKIIGGQFIVGYVGRSDTDLKRRLMQHTEAEKFSHFSYIKTNTIFEAFMLECREWHRYFKLGNAIHPDAPKNLPYRCPYCNASKEIKAGLNGRWLQ